MGGDAGEERRNQRHNNLQAALERMAGEFKDKRSTGVPRGDHHWAHWGYSFGGGETVSRPTKLLTALG